MIDLAEVVPHSRELRADPAHSALEIVGETSADHPLGRPVIVVLLDDGLEDVVFGQ